MASVPKYLAEVLAIAQTLPRGSVAHVAIRHQRACSFFEVGVCSCSPDVKMINAGDARPDSNPNGVPDA